MTRPPPSPSAPEPPDDDLRRELREFLVQAAVTLVVEGNAPPRPPMEEPSPPAPTPRRRGVLGPTWLSAFLLAAASMVALVHWWPQPVQLPDALRGRWTTAAPAFSGRELIIGEQSLGFRVDSGEPEQSYPVTARRITPRGDAQDVRIEYDTPEGRFTIIFSLSPDGIRLANRSGVVWTRTEALKRATPDPDGAA